MLRVHALLSLIIYDLMTMHEEYSSLLIWRPEASPQIILTSCHSPFEYRLLSFRNFLFYKLNRNIPSSSTATMLFHSLHLVLLGLCLLALTHTVSAEPRKKKGNSGKNTPTPQPLPPVPQAYNCAAYKPIVGNLDKAGRFIFSQTFHLHIHLFMISLLSVLYVECNPIKDGSSIPDPGVIKYCETASCPPFHINLDNCFLTPDSPSTNQTCVSFGIAEPEGGVTCKRLYFLLNRGMNH